MGDMPAAFILDDVQINQHRHLLPESTAERDRLEQELRKALLMCETLEEARTNLQSLAAEIDPTHELPLDARETLLRAEAIERTIRPRTERVRTDYANALLAYAISLRAEFVAAREQAVDRLSPIRERANQQVRAIEKLYKQTEIDAQEQQVKDILQTGEADRQIVAACEAAISAIESNVAAVFRADWYTFATTPTTTIARYAARYADRAVNLENAA